CFGLYLLQTRSNRSFEKARAGTHSPFEVKYQPSSHPNLSKNIAIKKPSQHPLDELEAALPDMVERKYRLFLKDLMAMFSASQNNLNDIEMRQKEVSHYAQKHQLSPSIITEWPSALIFYLLIFERLSPEEILAL